MDEGIPSHSKDEGRPASHDLDTQLGVLGPAPAQQRDDGELPVTPPPDVPPFPPSIAPGDSRISGGATQGGSGSGSRSGDPHWVWVPTSVLLACEAYWAKQRADYINQPVRVRDPQTGKVREVDPDEEIRLERQRLWDASQDEEQRKSRYIAWVTYQHMQAGSDQYAPEILHFEGVAEMVQQQVFAERARIAQAASEEMARAIIARIAPMAGPEILAAIQEVSRNV